MKYVAMVKWGSFIMVLTETGLIYRLDPSTKTFTLFMDLSKETKK